MSQPKTIVLTGVSRGLGRAMAEGFIGAGHVVYGCARNSDTISSLKDTYGAPHRFDVVDVADDSAVKRWAEALLADAVTIDLLINSAATINANNVLWEVPQQEFDQTIDVNIKGTANTIRHFVPAMIGSGGGVVVNFSSGWGRSTSPEVAPYCATKWAIEGLTQALAQELPNSMAAIPLNPGIINTDMLQSCFGAAADSYPDAQRWAQRAVPFILGLGPSDNGRPLTVE